MDECEPLPSVSCTKTEVRGRRGNGTFATCRTLTGFMCCRSRALEPGG